MTTKEKILAEIKDINYAYNDCSKYNIIKDLLEEMEEEMKEERKKGQWIPCTKQFPEFPCLVSDAQGNPVHIANGIHTVQYSTGERFAIEERIAWSLGKLYPEIVKANRIIAWMPLPEKYQENESNN